MEQVKLVNISFRYPKSDHFVLEDLSISLPEGIISLVGQNGTGKSTLLLLAAGILLPTEGKVYLKGIDTVNLRVESERQRYVSFIYQNMEFETEENIGDLLEYVYENGFHEKMCADLITTLIDVCELKSFLHKKTQEISKGELQRTIIAFSLLYGSKMVMMDEPIFALEDYQKKRIMEFLVHYARQNGISLYYSVHELDISEKYSDYLLLFSGKEPPKLGPTEEMFTRENIENIFKFPFSMLRKREALYRKTLKGLLYNRRN